MNELGKSVLARPKLRESPRVYPGQGKRSSLRAASRLGAGPSIPEIS
jgi:hypothetical protein